MREVWLRPNRRVLALALAPALLLIAMGAVLGGQFTAVAARVTGIGLIVAGAVLIVGIVLQMCTPRLAHADGCVLFYLTARKPIAVPVNVVEAFFLGQGPAHLPAAIPSGDADTVNLVARLSQRAPEWAQRDVKSALGKWCDGYVSIRGTWCEPLTGDVIRRLNRRLKEVQDAAESVPREVSG